MAHILLIDDAADICTITTLLLRSVGHTVTCALDGVTGLARARSDQPDLILMDLGLPRLNGYEATRRLKAHAATAHIPVVAFTANLAPLAIAEALAVGCAGVITKPFAIDDFLNEIDALLAAHVRQERLGRTRRLLVA